MDDLFYRIEEVVPHILWRRMPPKDMLLASNFIPLPSVAEYFSDSPFLIYLQPIIFPKYSLHEDLPVPSTINGGINKGATNPNRKSPNLINNKFEKKIRWLRYNLKGSFLQW